MSGKTVEGIADVAEHLGLGGGKMSLGEMTCTIGEEGDRGEMSLGWMELKSGGGRGSEAASGRQLLEQVVGLKGLGQNGFFFFLCKKSIGITRPSR